MHNMYLTSAKAILTNRLHYIPLLSIFSQLCPSQFFTMAREIFTNTCNTNTIKKHAANPSPKQHEQSQMHTPFHPQHLHPTAQQGSPIPDPLAQHPVATTEVHTRRGSGCTRPYVAFSNPHERNRFDKPDAIPNTETKSDKQSSRMNRNGMEGSRRHTNSRC